MPCPWHDFGLAGESLPVRAKSLWDSSNPWKTMKVEVILSQSCSTLCKPKDCSPPGSSVQLISCGSWAVEHRLSSCGTWG